jgi:ribosomal protein S12 methylthiotransferase accessory factor
MEYRMVPYLMPGVSDPGPKGFRRGTHRLVDPEVTVAHARRLMPAMGITRVANITGLDCIDVPVVMVCRPNARSLAVSQGKGLTLAAAKASALMEEIESYHAEHILLPLKLGSYEDLRKTHRLVDVDGLPRATNSAYHPHLQLLWIEGYDLLQQEPVWVPFEMVSLNFTLPPPGGHGCFAANSNGLASGNHLLEAISHALCEVIERDATTLAFLHDPAVLERSRVDPESVDDPGCREVLEKFERAEVAVAIWDTTSDSGVPTFECTIMERREDPLRLLYAAGGSGTHPSRAVALLRALTEAAQSRLTVIAGTRDDISRGDYERYQDPEVLRQARARLEVKGPLRSFREAPDWEGETFQEDVAWQLERLQSIGIRSVVAVDLTLPQFGLPVVKVVVPGLEGVLPEMTPTEYVPGARAKALLARKRLRISPIFAAQ